MIIRTHQIITSDKKKEKKKTQKKQHVYKSNMQKNDNIFLHWFLSSNQAQKLSNESIITREKVEERVRKWF